MKIKILFFIICSLMVETVYSQPYQWRLLPNSPGKTGESRFEDMHFINSNTGWVVGYNGEVFRTTNSGIIWNLIFTSTFGSEFRSVGFFDSITGLIGTLIPGDTNKILYRTTNGGLNWTSVTNISGRRPQGICGMSIVNENVAYACGRYFGSGRVIKTTNKGATWNLVLSDTSVVRTLIDCYFWSPDSGIAVGGSLPNLQGSAVVIRTTNGGNSWQRVHKTTRTNEWCWKISFISRNVGFVSVERDGGLAYILKTTNNGVNWTDIPFMEYDEEGIGFLNENTGWVGGWTGPTYQTTNGGTSWQLAGWGTNLNRFRFLSDTLAYAVGDRVYKYSRGPVGINLVSTEIPSSFNLYQNYPNPFNPVTKIKFDLPRDVKRETQDVRLFVFDVLGREVAKLINENLSPGRYEVYFNSDNLSSGVYFYKLEIEKFSDVKRMVVTK